MSDKENAQELRDIVGIYLTELEKEFYRKQKVDSCGEKIVSSRNGFNINFVCKEEKERSLILKISVNCGSKRKKETSMTVSLPIQFDSTRECLYIIIAKDLSSNIEQTLIAFV
jgi:hypothetical protein